jgi:membrane protease subunit HflC
LQQKINDALRAAFGNRQIMEVVAGERVDVMQKLQKEAKESAGNLGINVIDVRIKRIDLPTNVSNSVFNRMRTERQQYATLYRSRGKADAEKVRAKADKESAIIEAEARRKAAAIRGEGMNKAATTYANAYQQDVDFYTFYRAMQAYKQVFGHKDDVMVLTPNSEFMHYFKDLPKATEANQ